MTLGIPEQTIGKIVSSNIYGGGTILDSRGNRMVVYANAMQFFSKSENIIFYCERPADVPELIKGVDSLIIEAGKQNKFEARGELMLWRAIFK